jgi:UDP-N-acetylmuramate-alanine ligase
MQIIYLSTAELEHATIAPTSVLVAMPYTQADMAQQAAQLMSARTGVDGTILCVHDEDRRGFVQVANLIFKVTQSAYFAYVAQDAYPGRDWLSMALKALGQDKHLLGFNDGKWAGALAAFGLVRRSWAINNYQGQLFYDGYQQHYEDVELTLLAMQEGVYAYDPHAVLTEVDWKKDSKPVNLADKALFAKRSAQQFDGRVTQANLLKLFK